MCPAELPVDARRQRLHGRDLAVDDERRLGSGRLKPCSHRMISVESACADIESSRSIRAATGTHSP